MYVRVQIIFRSNCVITTKPTLASWPFGHASPSSPSQSINAKRFGHVIHSEQQQFTTNKQ